MYVESLTVTIEEAIIRILTKIIFTARYKDALNLQHILDHIPGQVKSHKRTTSQVNRDENLATSFHVQFLKEQTLSGMPPHERKLKDWQ